MCPISLYRPLTAVPFQRESAYAEAPPGPQLSPYVRCFWFSTPGLGSTGLVIPDTCADLIYRIDHTAHTLTGSFCGVSDESFVSHQVVPAGHRVHLFGIRFYAWTACLFAQDSLAGSRNRSVDPWAQFEWLDTALRQHLLELPTFSAQAAFARGLLETRLERISINPILQNAAGQMILSHGSLSVTQLAGEVFVSTRQLERVFQEYAGISPKRLNNLIRYQMLWQDCLTRRDFDIADAVMKFGYADQAHLCHEFKRYHTMDLTSAKALATKAVGNLQEKSILMG